MSCQYFNGVWGFFHRLSGKTSILRALNGLKPWNSGDREFDKDRDYPRRYLNDYADRHPDGDAEVVSATWRLEDTDKEALREVFGEVVNLDEFRVSKCYGSSVCTFATSVDEAAVTRHVLETSSLHAEEKSELSSVNTIAALKTTLSTPKSDRHKELLDFLNLHFSRNKANLAVIDLLYARMPEFLSFSQYQRMSGQVSLEDIIRKQSSKTLDDNDRVFLAFCDLVGVPVEDMAKLNQFESMVARFEAASNRITKELFRYWSQNKHLRVQCRLDAGRSGDSAPFNQGNVVRTRIYNEHHEVTVPFDERSTGFVWFFSFLVLFSQVKTTHGRNIIILLDEPALSLHAKAQADLLRYIEERLTPDHQVIYTTHSPFMVPSHNLTCVRTVEDVIINKGDGNVDVIGTKVGDKVLSTDRDTLFPLQGALGYEITQSLFLGKHTLLVEGPSDVLYLKAFSDELKKRGRIPLDPRWVICPMGGARKVTAFMNLFGANELNLAVLLDYVHGDKKQVEDVRKSQFLQNGRVLTAEHYAGMPEADVEDIIGGDLYMELVNKSYRLTAANRFPTVPAGGQVRVLPRVHDHFRTLPAGVPDLDHYTPSLYLFENRSSFFKTVHDGDDAFNRFESWGFANSQVRPNWATT